MFFSFYKDDPGNVRYDSARGGEVQRLELAVCDQYTIQGDRFAEAILHETPVPIPLEDAVRNMEVIEAVFASGCSGGLVRSGGG